MTSENGIQIVLEKVEDMADIMSYGVMFTLGVVVDGKIAHAGGIPDKKQFYRGLSCPGADNCC